MAPAQGSGSTGLVLLIAQFAAIIAIFYFLLIRPQSQARAKHTEMLANLKKGDEIVTAGGIVGKVKDMKDSKITIESGTSTLVVERSRIVQIGSVVSPTANR
jgi:preprotein translocase subunit YajC